MTSYFGMREVSLCVVGGVQRPCINGEWRFLVGWLDQSLWPDGLYTAPGEAALVSDVSVVRDYGLNVLRLHQVKRTSMLSGVLFYVLGGYMGSLFP